MEESVHNFLRTKKQNLQTPTYVYFKKQLQKNIKQFSVLEKNDIKVFYAMKANNYSPVISELIKSGFGFDVASKEEIHHVLSLGADPSRITFSAPSKKIEDIRYAHLKGVQYFAFDSEAELEKLVSCVDSPKLFARISVSSKDAAFNLSSKFGMTEKYFVSILKKTKTKKWPIVGITFHVGSQNISLHAWRDALEYIDRLIEISQHFGTRIKYVNLGGGIPAAYLSRISTVDKYIHKIIQFCNKLVVKRPGIQFFIEPGRALVANTFVLLTKVIDIKPYKNPPLVIVDTGVFNGIIEPLEGFEYPVFQDHFGERKTSRFRIGGFSCEGYDIINRSVKLPKDISLNEIIPIMYAGAYTFVYHDFHMVPYPQIIKSNF